MSYRLFYAHGSAAMAVRVLLEEIGTDYTLVPAEISVHKPRGAEHLRLNPNGWVPVLAWEDRAMHECAAVVIYLVDRYPQAALGPSPEDRDRPLFLQTLVYFSNTVQTAFQQFYYPERFASDPDARTGAMARGVRRLREVWGVVDAQIGNQSWMIGDRFSAADAMLYMLADWLDPEAGHPPVEDFPNVSRVVQRAAERESIKRAYGL